MKAFSQSIILEVPFDSFKNRFDRTLHFKLRGANSFVSNLTRAAISQPPYNPNIILVKERKGLRWEYFPSQNGYTIAQCYVKYDTVSIILWIIMIVITLGIAIIFLFIKLIGESVSTKNYIKRLNSKKVQILAEEFGSHNTQNINYTQKIIQQNPQTVVKSIPPPISNNAEYFVAINGEQKGPYDLEKITVLIDIGQIQENTLLWRQGMLQWAEAKQIEEINLMLK